MSIGNSNIHQVSEIPEITKLPNGRLRVVRRFNKFTREDVDDENLGSLMGDFGDLDTTGEQIVNQGYTNLRLISVEVDNRFNAVTNNSNPVLVKTYETLTNAFVQVTDEDQVEELENGRKRITRVFRAQSGTTYSGDVGSTNAGGSNTSFILAKSDLKDTGAFAELTLTFITTGIDNIREDIIGSQKAIIITKTGSEPTASDASTYSDITYDGSSDWSIARKDNSRVDGLDVYTYTFLLDNTVLSVSEDKVGSQEAYVEEVFNPLVTIPGITISGGSSVAGDYFLGSSTYNLKNRYFTADGGTYAKLLQYTGSVWEVRQLTSQYATNSGTNPNNEDDPPETGWLGTGNNLIENLSFRDFDNTLPHSLQGLSTSHRYEKDGYVLAKMDRSNIDGIPTVRYTFLRPSVLSVNKSNNDANGSISVQAFNLNSDNSTIIDSTGAIVDSDTHLLVEERVSDFDGIPTKTFIYQKKKFFQKATGDNGLTQITRVEQQASSATDFVIKNGQQGGVTHHSSNDTDTETDLNGESGTYYLSSQKIDNNNLVEIRTSIFTKGGKLSENTVPYTISGIETITITSIGAEETLPEGDSIKLFKKEDSDVSGVKKFSRTYIKGVNATSTTTSFTSGKIYQMNATVDFSSVGGPSVGVVGDYFKATSTATVTDGNAYLVSDITNDATASYEDIVEVQIPGSVAIETSNVSVGGISGTIATTNVTPITRKKVVATVTQQIKTTLDDLSDTDLAYDLRGISCSVNFTNLTEEVGGGTSVTVGTDTNQLTSSGFNRRLTAGLRNQFYIGHYLIHDKKTATGTFSYTSNSTPKITGGSLATSITRTSESKNIITGTGSESQDDADDSPPDTYRTSGTLSINTRPLFTTVDGTVFYEVVKYTV